MSKKPNSRFGYLDSASEPTSDARNSAPPTDTLTTVPKGQGRMEQDRTQLNVRIPTALKRRAAAKAALEGSTLGDIVEQLLQSYIEVDND